MGRLKEFYPKSPIANLAVAGVSILVGNAMMRISETPPEAVAKDIGGAICAQFDLDCPWIQETPPLAKTLQGGELRVNTTILRGLKAYDARVTMERDLPGIDVTTDSSASMQSGTVGIEAKIDGIIAVSPRSIGSAVALTDMRGNAIDISNFKITPLEPYERINGQCPELQPGDIDHGCKMSGVDIGDLSGVPILGSNNKHDIPTKVGKVVDVYMFDQRCPMEHQLLPIMRETARTYLSKEVSGGNYDIDGLLATLEGPERFTEMAIILGRGALRDQFGSLGSAQKIIIPMYGRVPSPEDIVSAFNEVAISTGGAVKPPANLAPDYCTNTTMLGEVQRDELASQVAKLMMKGLAPPGFNTDSMQWEHGNEMLQPPTTEEMQALGVYEK